MKKRFTLILASMLLTMGAWAQTTPVLTYTDVTAPTELSADDVNTIRGLSGMTFVADVELTSSSDAQLLFAAVADYTSSSTENNSIWGLGLGGNSLRYIVGPRDGGWYSSTDGSLTTAAKKIIFTYDGTTIKYYVDGTNVKSQSSTKALNTFTEANAKFYLGGVVYNTDTKWGTFSGTLSKVEIYNSVFSDAEIMAMCYPEEVVKTPGEFENGKIYTFVSSRGWMGATESCDNVISTAKTSHGVTGAADNNMFQWTVYKSNNGNYYLYNIGKQQFMGVQSSNNSSVPFADIPQGKKLTFKQSSSSTHPIMFSTDNAGVVNHSTDYGDGLITWTGGWDKLDDAGSNHQVTYVSRLPEATLQEIAAKVEAYDKVLPITTVVTDLGEDNPNTHFGSVRATNDAGETLTKLLRGDAGALTMVNYDGTKETTIDFTREYRGFEFQGYYVGEQSLGKSFTLTDELKSSITEENPLVAKFTATDDVTLFYDDDEFSYRIPAIATTSTGRLIAVSDYRHCLDDIGMNRWGKGYRIDLVIRTSDDNGKTWSPIKTIAEGIDNSTADDCAYGDAAIAVVGEEVIVMAVAGSVQYGTGTAERRSRVVRVYSANNGEDWEKTDITEKVYGYENALYPTVYTAFFGSGKLAVDPDFNESGVARIYGSLLTQGKGNQVIYSDDKGLTWHQLGTEEQVANANEPKVEILPSGQILFSARRSGGRQFNVFTYSDKANNTGTWSGTANGCDNGGSNGTNGEIFCVDAKKADGTAVKLLLQSQPKGGSNEWDRKDVTIWYKEINGTSYTAADIAADWTEGLQVSNQKSAYSAMTMQKDGKVAFFFEEAPCYQDRNDWGYSMVYAPLTIENITKGNYFSTNTDLSADVAVNVVLTDAEGNEYRDQLTCALNGIAAAVTAKYPFITLGDNANLSLEGQEYTYTNSVTLPFKVSNEDNTVWYNIYFPSNTSNGYPVYMSADTNSDVVKISTEAYVYGNSKYNTSDNADKISWAIYNVDNGFTFKLKNKLNGQYIKTTATATANNGGEIVKYTSVLSEATAFGIADGRSNSYRGEYGLSNNSGYLMAWSVSNGYVTYSTNTGHQGAWAKFVEAPDFAALIDEVNSVLSLFGEGLGEYKPSEANAATLETAKTAMQNSGSVEFNELNTYKALLTGAVLNLPQAGQFFRLKGVSGNYIDATSIYGNANATTGQMSMKSGEQCNLAGTIFYLDAEKHLLNYATGTYVKQTREIGGVNDTKGVWTFAESPRRGGKYALSCTTTGGAGANLHDNQGNRADRCSSNCGERHDFTLEEVTELPVAVSTVGYATLYAPVALQVPSEDITAHTVTVKGDMAILSDPLEVIPAETGVVLVGEGAHNFIIATANETATSALAGTFAKTYVEGSAYVLANGESGVGLYKAKLNKDASGNAVAEGAEGTHFINNAFKAYLPASAVTSGAQALRFTRGGDDETTSIDNAQLTIDNENVVIYDLMGRRVEKMEKGIYIVNGKKVIR